MNMFMISYWKLTTIVTISSHTKSRYFWFLVSVVSFSVISSLRMGDADVLY